MLRNILFLIIFTQFIILRSLNAQACCSAGTPLISSLDIAATPAKSLNVSVNYEYNFLDNVYSGSQQIEGNRERLSQSVLWEMSYGINDRWSITKIISYIQQRRRLKSKNVFNSNEELTTRGIGDALIIIKYNLLPLTIIEQRQIALGLGIKAPTGKSDIEWDGILLPADMQPGTGSWDGIFWAYFYQGFLPVTRLNVFANASYRFNGNNNRFKISNSNFSGYKFGNELITTAGLSYRTDSFFYLSLLLRYRQVDADEFAKSEVANTSGKWIYLLPGVNINFNSFSIRVSGQIPVYRNLNGVQLTTSYSAMLSVFYSFVL